MHVAGSRLYELIASLLCCRAVFNKLISQSSIFFFFLNKLNLMQFHLSFYSKEEATAFPPPPSLPFLDNVTRLTTWRYSAAV